MAHNIFHNWPTIDPIFNKMFRFIILSLRQMFHPPMKTGKKTKYNSHEIRKWKEHIYGQQRLYQQQHQQQQQQQQRKSTTNHKIDEWVSNGQHTRGSSRRNLKSKLSRNNRSTRSCRGNNSNSCNNIIDTIHNDDWVSNDQHPRVAYALFRRASESFEDTLYSSGSSNSSNSRRRHMKIKSSNCNSNCNINSIDDSFSSTMYSDDGWLTENPIATTTTTDSISFQTSFLKSTELQQ